MVVFWGRDRGTGNRDGLAGREPPKAKNPAAKPNWAVSNELSKEAVILEGGAQEVTDPSRIKELARPDQRSYKP
ncbi:MAG TPA: hypothetical protein VE083_12555 [Terriglobales bacterium]|nr:hypothetical protein [Terriglobales bacterium]